MLIDEYKKTVLKRTQVRSTCELKELVRTFISPMLAQLDQIQPWKGEVDMKSMSRQGAIVDFNS